MRRMMRQLFGESRPGHYGSRRGPFGPQGAHHFGRVPPPPPRENEVEDDIVRDVMKDSVIDANAISSAPGSDKPMCRFVKDLTFPDSSEVSPGQTFEKVWLVRNDGEVSWPPSTELTFVSGDDLPATKVYSVPSNVVPGQEVPLTVQLVAPPVEGRFISYFRLQNLDTRVPFGQRLWCDFRVCANTDSSRSENCGAACGVSSEQLEELPEAIAAAISSVVSGEDAPHDALGKLLKTWQMVQHEDARPASAMPAPGVSVPPSSEEATDPSAAPSNETLEAVAVDENAEGSEDDWQTLWQNEVTLLVAMGFETFGDVLPLLQKHLIMPLSMKPTGPEHSAIDADGFHKVVNALLAARARDTEATKAAEPRLKAP